MPEPQPSGGFEWTQAPWGRALRCVPLARVSPHWFTVANLQLRDPHEWDTVAAALGVPRCGVRLLRQVHGAALAVARRGDRAPWPTPEADVVVSDDPSLAVGVQVADCAPILLADRRHGVVSAAHAGWRGTVQSVASVAVAALRREFGSHAEDIVAAIGPCLGPCCGEVGEEVVQAFREAGHRETALARWFSAGPRGRPMLDLWTANADQLREAGIPPEQVHVAGLCTRTHAGLMHSYRASGIRTGRMTGIIRAAAGA